MTANKSPARNKPAAKPAVKKQPTAKPAAKKKTTAKPAAQKKPAAKPTRAAAGTPAKPRAAAPRSADEVFAEVDARAAEVGVVLRPGASAKDIARTEQALGLSLPADVRAWFARHDGSAGEDFPYLWPLAFIREQRQSFADMLAPHNFVLGGVEDSVSYIDLSPEGGGRIFHFSAEDGPEPAFDGFLEWLVSFTWDWDLD